MRTPASWKAPTRQGSAPSPLEEEAVLVDVLATLEVVLEVVLVLVFDLVVVLVVLS